MKREELKALGLTDEVIESVMTMNGKDITKHQTAAQTAQTTLETLQGQLTEANKQIEGFKNMDVDSIKKAADDYKTKWEQAQTDAAAQIAAVKFDHALESALTGAKAKNPKAVKALLSSDLLKLQDDGTIAGLKEQLEKIQTDNDYLFESAEKPPVIVKGGNNQSVVTDAFEDAMRKGANLTTPSKS